MRLAGFLIMGAGSNAITQSVFNREKDHSQI